MISAAARAAVAAVHVTRVTAARGLGSCGHVGARGVHARPCSHARAQACMMRAAPGTACRNRGVGCWQRAQRMPAAPAAIRAGGVLIPQALSVRSVLPTPARNARLPPRYIHAAEHTPAWAGNTLLLPMIHALSSTSTRALPALLPPFPITSNSTHLPPQSCHPPSCPCGGLHPGSRSRPGRAPAAAAPARRRRAARHRCECVWGRREGGRDRGGG